MKKLFFLLCLALFFIGCASEDDSSDDGTQQVDPNDLDGDSIPNQQEIIDGTDPENPCDYTLDNIFYPDTNNQWRSLDCDGDGVTNGIELDPDGNNAVDIGWITNPQEACSLRVEKQTVTPSDQWLAGDCDDDSFSNGQEVLDGTDLNDPCSFILGNQDLESTVTFRRGDCDNDGRTNLEEIIDGTDLFDVNDPYEDGTIISEIILSNSYLDDVPFKSISFTDNGSKLNEIKEEGILKTKFHYDNSNRLSLVEKFPSESLTESFEYSYDVQNRISSITKTTNDNGQINSETLDFVYVNNFIYRYDNNNNIIFEAELSTEGKFLEASYYEPYFDSTINHTKFDLVFEYDETTGNLKEIHEYNQYWSAMYQFYSSDLQSFTNRCKYDDTRPNYFLNVYENIYFNYILEPKIFEFHFYMEEKGSAGLFEDNFQTSSVRFDFYSTFNNFSLGDHIYQENGFPFTAKGVPGQSPLSGRKVYFFYE